MISRSPSSTAPEQKPCRIGLKKRRNQFFSPVGWYISGTDRDEQYKWSLLKFRRTVYTAAWTAALIAARKSHPALQGAALQDLFTDETAFVFVRTANLGRCTADHAHEAVLVILNTKPVPRSLTIPAGDTAPEGCRHLQLLAPVDNGSTFVLNGAVQVELPADSFSLFLVR